MRRRGTTWGQQPARADHQRSWQGTRRQAFTGRHGAVDDRSGGSAGRSGPSPSIAGRPLLRRHPVSGGRPPGRRPRRARLQPRRHRRARRPRGRGGRRDRRMRAAVCRRTRRGCPDPPRGQSPDAPSSLRACRRALPRPSRSPRSTNQPASTSRSRGSRRSSADGGCRRTSRVSRAGSRLLQRGEAATYAVKRRKAGRQSSSSDWRASAP